MNLFPDLRSRSNREVRHSTISRTRQLIGKEVFESLFEKVFSMCVEKGMVSGETQCIDSALIKANASLDSLFDKQPDQDSPPSAVMKVVAPDVNEQDQGPKRPAKFDRSTQAQRTLSASDFELA